MFFFEKEISLFLQSLYSEKVKAFQQTREKLGYKLLKRNVMHRKRTKRFHNFNTAKSVFILFDARDLKILDTIKKIAEYISAKNIKVTSAGYVEKLPDKVSLAYIKSVALFSGEKSSFLGIPKSKEYHSFNELKSDIVINLCLEKLLPVDYLFGMSKAEFKISSTRCLDCSDLSIDITQNSSVDFLIEQIIKYLEMIEVQ